LSAVSSSLVHPQVAIQSSEIIHALCEKMILGIDTHATISPGPTIGQRAEAMWDRLCSGAMILALDGGDKIFQRESPNARANLRLTNKTCLTASLSEIGSAAFRAGHLRESKVPDKVGRPLQV